VTGAAGGGVDELRLEAIAGNATGFTIVVGERLVIGRQSDGPGKLADDPELSRHHAEIERDENGQFTIKDLSSTNGTYVNGAQITAPTLLKLDDEIELGGTKLVVRSVPETPPAEPPPAVDVRARTVMAAGPPVMPAPEPDPVPVHVHLTVDFEAEAARLAVASDGEPIRLELADGQWRVAAGDA